jgi:hypothetical protein
MSDLRTRIAALLYTRFTHALGYADAPWDSVDHEPWLEDADAVIAELDMGNPCATTGCRMRYIARRHAEMSSKLSETEPNV